MAARIEEQRLVVSRCPTELQPRLHGGDGSLPEWTRTLFAPLAAQAHEGESGIVQVLDVEVDDLLDACAGVVQEEQECPVAVPTGGRAAVEQLDGLILVEIGRFGVFSVPGGSRGWRGIARGAAVRSRPRSA